MTVFPVCARLPHETYLQSVSPTYVRGHLDPVLSSVGIWVNFQTFFSVLMFTRHVSGLWLRGENSHLLRLDLFLVSSILPVWHTEKDKTDIYRFLKCIYLR